MKGESIMLVHLFNEETFDWIDGINIDILNKGISFLVFDAPFWMVLGVIGGVFLIISGFIKS